MNILHIVPSYKPAYVYGGPIESVARLCEGLAEAGHTVKVYTTTANGKTELDVVPGKEINIDGVSVTYFKRITKDHSHISLQLWRHLIKHCRDYDVIHIHSWWNILVIVAALVCHQKKAKVIIAPRGMLSNYIFTATRSTTKKWLHYLVGKRALAKAYFHATAQSEFEECAKIIPHWKGFVLPNILLLPAIKVKRTKNEVFTMIFLSRIHPKKGIELLLEAISLLPFKVVLKVAGSGEEAYLQELTNKARALNIADKIKWLGWKSREDKFTELISSDLFVLTSYNENFANVVIESLHVGTPVLISEQVGLASFVQENDLGWVTSLNVQSIKASIIDAFTNKEKRAFIAKNGIDKIKENFSEKILIKKYAQNYQQLISDKA